MAAADRIDHWRKTRSLMWQMVALWIGFAFVLPLFVGALNGVVILGFPLGFYMVAQGSLIIFVAMLFWFARKQDAIDETHTAGES